MDKGIYITQHAYTFYIGTPILTVPCQENSLQGRDTSMAAAESNQSLITLLDSFSSGLAKANNF